MRHVLYLLVLLGASALAASNGRPVVTAVDSVGLTVSDLDRSVAFYTGVLTFEKVAEREADGTNYEHLEGVFGAHMRVARLRLGDEFLELTEYLAPQGQSAPIAARSNDRWFQHVAIIVSDMDAAYKRLREARVQFASPSPQTLPAWNPSAGGIRAFYFRDPDGHPLEVLQFPPDKGRAKWHAQTNRLFLGIDHTAIVVSDTDASLRFYRDTLGMQVAGESENYGIEQERLNNVIGAHLRITSLRAASGPGVEFLEYLTPRDGRPYPAGERPNDLIHWQTQVHTSSVAGALRELRAIGAPIISSGEVDLGSAKAAIVRDPDGHAVELTEF